MTGSQQVASGALSIADPRPGMSRTKGDAYLTGGHYGVVDYTTRPAPFPPVPATITAGGRLPISVCQRPMTG